MKKVLAMCFALLLMFNMCAFSGFAEEIDTSEHDELIALACDVFPEYTDAICGSKNIISSASSRTCSDGVIFTETRSVNDSEFVTISQFSDGSVSVLSSNFHAQVIDSDIVGYTTRQEVTASFKATMDDCSGVFTVKNFQCTNYWSGYDKIDSIGTYSCNSYVKLGTISQNLTETSSQFAYVKYRLTFAIGTSNYPIALTITVHNDNWYYGID